MFSLGGWLDGPGLRLILFPLTRLDRKVIQVIAAPVQASQRNPSRSIISDPSCIKIQLHRVRNSATTAMIAIHSAIVNPERDLDIGLYPFRQEADLGLIVPRPGIVRYPDVRLNYNSGFAFEATTRLPSYLGYRVSSTALS